MRRILKLNCIVTIIVLSILISGCGKSQDTGFQEVSLENPDEKGASGEKETVLAKDTERVEKIYIHICGEVKHPGVYELNAGSRIFEAVEAAGGFTKKAAQHSVNQAQILSDGQQLYIFSDDEVQNQSAENQGKDQGKVDINRASKEELMTLPGIGESKADAIIRYREERGGFSSIEAIMEIEGIKEGVFRKIEDQITAS